jgi:hypothetical protein
MFRRLIIATVLALACSAPFVSTAAASSAPAPRYCSGCVVVPVLQYVQQKPSASSTGQTVYWHYLVTGYDYRHAPAPGMWTQAICTVFTVFNTGTVASPVYSLSSKTIAVSVAISGAPGWSVARETVWGGTYPPAGGVLTLASVSCTPWPYPVIS